MSNQHENSTTAVAANAADLDISASHIQVPVSIVLHRSEVRGKFWSVPAWSLDSVLVGHQIATLRSDANPVLLSSALPAGSADTQAPELAAESSGRQLIKPEQAEPAEKPERYLWHGYAVNFHRDACERYWHSLIGEKPLVYVVLAKDEIDDSVEPALVTVDYDEAVAHCETDNDVLTATIPGELYRLMEHYVMTHYRPVEFKKRKRKNWSDQAQGDAGQENREERLDPWDDRRRFHRSGYHGES